MTQRLYHRLLRFSARGLLLTLMLFVQLSYAKTFSYITKIERAPDELYYRYYGTLLAWDTNDSTPNPCYMLSCWIAAAPLKKDGTFLGNDGAYQIFASTGQLRNNAEVSAAKTVGEVARIYQKLYSLPLNVNIVRSNPKGEIACFGMIWTISLQGGDPTPFQSSCGIPPPEYSGCSFDDASLLLDHRNMVNQKLLNGHQVSGSVTVRCTMPTALVISISSGDDSRITLTKGLTSRLTINDRSAHDGVDFTAGADGTRLVITSTLSATGTIKPGDYNASTVAILSFR